MHRHRAQTLATPASLNRRCGTAPDDLSFCKIREAALQHYGAYPQGSTVLFSQHLTCTRPGCPAKLSWSLAVVAVWENEADPLVKLCMVQQGDHTVRQWRVFLLDVQGGGEGAPLVAPVVAPVYASSASVHDCSLASK